MHCNSSDTVGAIAFGSQSSVESNRYKVIKEKLKNKTNSWDRPRVVSSIVYQ